MKKEDKIKKIKVIKQKIKIIEKKLRNIAIYLDRK